MVTPVEAAVSAAFAAQKAVRGESVTYNNGTTSASITAVRGQTIWEPKQSPIDGTWIEERSTDWLIESGDLSGAPAAGHTITDESGQKYKVLPFGDAELVFRWHDRGRTVYRVFSKDRA